uniref:Translocating chain-associated membrane protein n=1 Tax=Oncorhynchus kisutch TaxID=8019 RepID=A0A8C7D3L5_ONCKI
MGFRKKTNKNPPVLSHEFIIQNHADIVSCVAMVFLLGLMFEVTSKVAVLFITVQYNVTISANEGLSEESVVNHFHHGLKDLATIFFYMLVAIIIHAIIQEYVLDKINRKMHFSKTKHSKFNESGQLSAFYLFSFGWGTSILMSENFLSNPVSLWDGYPHTLMPFQMKFYFISQMGYWLHALPEIYFQKTKKEDIPRQLVYISLYLVHIAGAYILNQSTGLVMIVLIKNGHVTRVCLSTRFSIWAVLFVLGRLLTLSLSVLTVGFGLSNADQQGLDLANGNFNVLIVRITVLATICVTQAFMMWKFINFQLRRWREQAQVQPVKPKKLQAPKTKSKKDKANGVNGVSSNGADSPRAKKEKSS